MNARLLTSLLCLALACSSSSSDGYDDGDNDQQSDNDAGSDGDGDVDPGPQLTVMPAVISSNATCSTGILMPQSTTVAAGATLTMTGSCKVSAIANTRLVINGSLVLAGTAANPVRLTLDGVSGKWDGVLLNGSANLQHIEIGFATVAFTAAPGSTYTIDDFVIDTSDKLLDLQSSGSIAHGQFRTKGGLASGDQITITSASPQFSHCDFIGTASTGVDFIVVSGATSAPSFDHVAISGTHGGFFLESGDGVVISHSVVHDTVFALQIFNTLDVSVTSSNFQDNDTILASCTGGTVVFNGCYFDDTVLTGDCASQTNNSSVGAPLTDVGPTF